MDWITSLIVGLLGIVVGVIGRKQIRRWTRLDEPEPYFVSSILREALQKDSVVWPLLRAEEEAGNHWGFQSMHQAPTKEREGLEYVRAGRQKIVYRSKTLAHDHEIVLMVQRG